LNPTVKYIVTTSRTTMPPITALAWRRRASEISAVSAVGVLRS
jgi:hypothetical protein